MKTIMKRIPFTLVLIFLLPAVSFGFGKMSELIKDRAAGMNGGFEHTKSNLPVNWIVYSPSTIPTGKYELKFDTEDFKEGKQSLHFVVHECSSKGGRLSPGITQEYPAKPGQTYRVSYWVKNEGCQYQVVAGGVDAVQIRRLGIFDGSSVDCRLGYFARIFRRNSFRL